MSQLQNIIERMMNIVCSNELTPDLIPEEITNLTKISPADELLESPEEIELKTIMKLLHLKFPKNMIAKKMNISRMTLYRKMGKYGLK